MEDEVIVLSVGKPYSFTTEDGNKLEGCAMYYINAKELVPVETEDCLGFVPLKETMPVSFYDRAKVVGIPCRARVHYVMRNSKGKQVLKIDGLDFIEDKKK